MKKSAGFFLMFIYWGFVQAQESGEEGVDLLKAPSSPAAQLLNFAPNSIERPTDLSSFWLSFNNATSNLTRLPNSYAVDFLPASLFTSRFITLKDLQSVNTGKIFWQTLDISLGYNSDTSGGQSFSRTAIGIKFSVIRPAWTSETYRKYKRLSELQSSITEQVEVADEEIEADSAYAEKLRERRRVRTEHGMNSPQYEKINAELQLMRDSLFNKFRTEKIIRNNSAYTELRKMARDFTIERSGPFLDFAGGSAIRFPTNDLGYSYAENAGAWLTGGYEGGNQKLSLYGLARYLYQPERIYADPGNTISTKNISTLDMGARVLYASKDDKFNLSFESIYRSVLTKSIIDPSWRLSFSAEYDLGFNQKLTFNFGRDFDREITKSGNLIATFNFIVGFGNKRIINGSNSNNGSLQPVPDVTQ
ncbi:MAG TPA: hypothetical protein VIZ28_14775 [Chitinophagaceae bacterium]